MELTSTACVGATLRPVSWYGQRTRACPTSACAESCPAIQCKRLVTFIGAGDPPMRCVRDIDKPPEMREAAADMTAMRPPR